jgi:hypothetical protein
MKTLDSDLQNEIQLGALSFLGIARKYHVPVSRVKAAWDLLCEKEANSHEYLAPDCDSWYDQQYEVPDQ